MLVFIDESGCSGFKLARGSDAVFAIGMVIFCDRECALRTEKCLAALHDRLGHKPEFKFSKLNDRSRASFFAAVADCPFTFRALVVDKERASRELRFASQGGFHDFFIKQLILRAGARLENANVSIDGVGSRHFERLLRADLRQLLGAKIADVRLVDSRRDAHMQLADMCVGAVARAFRPHAERNRWLRMLESHLEDVWEFR